MSAEGGNKAVVAALLANLGIAVTKLVAFLLTGLSSMLAEAIHSVADSGNQLLLLLGGAGRDGRDPGAPVRLRPGALHLRVHRGDRAVLRRRPVRPLRGVPQVPRDPRCQATRTRSSTAAGGGCRSSSWASRSCWRAVFRTAISETNKIKGGGRSRVHPPGQAARAAGDPAGGLRGAARPAFALLGVGLSLVTENLYFDVVGTALIGLLLVPWPSSWPSRPRACCSGRPRSARRSAGSRGPRAGPPASSGSST